MFSLIVHDETAKLRVGNMQLGPHTQASEYRDYVHALRAFREQERQLGPTGIVLLRKGRATAQMSVNDPAVLRSAFGSSFPRSASVVMPVSTARRLVLQELVPLLNDVQEGVILKEVEQGQLDDLIELIDHIQERVYGQGIPRGIIWPNQAQGEAGELEEKQLKKDDPELARQLGI